MINQTRSERRSEFKKLGQEVTIFQQTDAHFQQRRRGCL